MPYFGFARRRFLAQVGRAALLVTGATVPSMRQSTFANPEEPLGEVKTLEPDQEGRLPLERTLAKRRSVRDFARGSLTLAELSQLLWAGQGITNRLGFRKRNYRAVTSRAAGSEQNAGDRFHLGG